METIITYLDNMFASLPKTKELLNLKNEIKNNMEDKYHELKENGKSENEAIGIVISEFGNIEEIISEYDINISNDKTKDEEKLPNVTLEEASEYIKLNKKSAFIVSIGVSLCLLGAAVMVLLVQLAEDKLIFSSYSKNLTSSIPIIVALVFFIAPAVTLFIGSGIKLSKYKFIDTGDFSITSATKQILKKDSMEFPEENIITIIGVCLCVLSPVCIFVGRMVNENGGTYGVVGTLIIITIAVFLFINNGAYHEAYKKLLKCNEFSAKNKKKDKVIGAVAGVVWPLATCAFLVAGLVYNLWYICWIVFPITGILFGAFCGVYSSIKENSDSAAK
jgi:uncharacterized membrane protein